MSRSGPGQDNAPAWRRTWRPWASSEDTHWSSEDTHWVAPAQVLVEVLSVVRGGVLGGELSIERGDEAVSAMTELAIEVVDPASLVERMWELRDNVTAYDAAYLAVAESVDAPLVTGDARLARIPGTKCTVQIMP